MVKSLDLLVNPSKLEFPIKVRLADESYLEASHIGDVHLAIGDTLLTLEKVLFIPSIQRNLFSVPKFTSGSNAKVTFGDGLCVLWI